MMLELKQKNSNFITASKAGEGAILDASFL